VNDAFGLDTCCVDGTSDHCDQPGFPDRALTIVGHLSRASTGKLPFAEVTAQIGLGRPISVAIAWFDGGGHNVVVSGYDTRGTDLTIDDPWTGTSYSVPYRAFPGNYRFGATWSQSYFTE
jgi:hypothetical protein